MTTENTPEETGEDAPAPEQTPEEKAAAEKQAYSEKVQKRINSEVGKRKQAEEAARKAELEAAELRGKAAALEQVGVPKAPAPEPMKKPGGRDDYDTDDEWLEAHKAYDAHMIREGLRKEFAENQAKREAEAEARQQKEREEAATRAAHQSFIDSVKDAKTKYDDYDTVVHNPDLVLNADVVDAIKGTDNPGEVAYALASNPEESARISALSPVQIGREVAKIEARLAQPNQKKVTRAPDPLEPLKASGEVSGKDPDKMSQSEYEAWRYREKK